MNHVVYLLNGSPRMGRPFSITYAFKPLAFSWQEILYTNIKGVHKVALPFQKCIKIAID